jgi:hypothetical protein
MKIPPFGGHFDFGVFGDKMTRTVLIRGLQPDPEHLRRPKRLVQHSSRRSWECIRSVFLVGEAPKFHIAFGEKESFWSPFLLPFLVGVRL